MTLNWYPTMAFCGLLLVSVLALASPIAHGQGAEYGDVEGLLRDLESGNLELQRRSSAKLVIHVRKNPAVVDALMKALEHDDMEIRRNAGYNLATVSGSERIRAALRRAMIREVEEGVSVQSGRNLAKLASKDPVALGMLLDLLKSDREAERGAAVKALRSVRGNEQRIGDAIVEILLSDVSGGQGVEAVGLLVGLNVTTPRVLGALELALKSPSTACRVEAAWALSHARRAGKSDGKALALLIGDGVAGIRAAATWAEMGTSVDSAVEALRVALEAGSAPYHCLDALGKLGAAAHSVAPLLLALAAEPGGDLTFAALSCLPKISAGDERLEAKVVSLCRQYLTADDWYAVHSALRALTVLGPAAADAVPETVAVLKREKIGTQRLAILALGAMGPKAGVATEELVTVGRQRAGFLTMDVVRALNRIGPSAAGAEKWLSGLSEERPDLSSGEIKRVCKALESVRGN